jgi:hypothetical protein
MFFLHIDIYWGGFYWIIHYIATWFFFKVRFSFRFNQHPESWPFQSLSGCAINQTKQTIFQYEHWRGSPWARWIPIHMSKIHQWDILVYNIPLMYVCIYIYTIDVSLNGGTPSYHPFIARIFHEINHPSSYWVAIWGNPPYVHHGPSHSWSQLTSLPPGTAFALARSCWSQAPKRETPVKSMVYGCLWYQNSCMASLYQCERYSMCNANQIAIHIYIYMCVRCVCIYI